jgi:hypothetical protein
MLESTLIYESPPTQQYISSNCSFLPLLSNLFLFLVLFEYLFFPSNFSPFQTFFLISKNDEVKTSMGLDFLIKPNIEIRIYFHLDTVTLPRFGNWSLPFTNIVTRDLDLSIISFTHKLFVHTCETIFCNFHTCKPNSILFARVNALKILL